MKAQLTQKDRSMDHVKYHSMLNAIENEFERQLKNANPETQKRMLALAMSIVDAFAEIYGEHAMKKASNAISRMLVTQEFSDN